MTVTIPREAEDRMPLSGNRTYVGFGLGPIQIGLFLYEAYRSGNFGRLVTAEVNPDLVSALRRAGGRVRFNIAYQDHLEAVSLEGIEVYDPREPADREELISAVSAADEIGTAVPSVASYTAGGSGSIQRLLAQGLACKAAAGGPPCAVYAAENHNRAAQILAECVHPPAGAAVQFVNTVIGKMSQSVPLARGSEARGLAPLASGYPQAVLVESFNRILISQVRLPVPYTRGLAVFEEKPDLLPFEEAKLFGHNAIHTLMGCLGACLGIGWAPELSERPAVLAVARDAFVGETGAALCRKYGGSDSLFTPRGMAQCAEDLMARMVNPFLRDRVDRLIRDLPRKLGWEDRFIGAIRLCLSQDSAPERLAFGAAAALFLQGDRDPGGIPEALAGLRACWQAEGRDPVEMKAVNACLVRGAEAFLGWQASGFSPDCLPQGPD